jgi:hypothetical protein
VQNLVVAAVGNNYPLVRDFVNLGTLGFLMMGTETGRWWSELVRGDPGLGNGSSGYLRTAQPKTAYLGAHDHQQHEQAACCLWTLKQKRRDEAC